ncbi:DegV family protein [Streptococcus massiliensis]|uniref:DegV family protein n=1 Tax=Streptococcus massiliensis TaxID=313439 RepID=A0A380KWJ1_9STRE|nr:DegV family protein [Streptococcus massiliensis]SUN76118.1 DegV family protein [Streptococcus massiliensis]
MKIAVITDSSAYLTEVIKKKDNLFVLDIPVIIDGVSYVEGENLTAKEFYQKMAASSELPKTSQPSVAELEKILSNLPDLGYTHVLGIFLSSGISGFYQNIQYLKDEFEGLTIAFPDSKITSAPLGKMVSDSLMWAEEGLTFEQILNKIEAMAADTTAYILVDDLNHLVKGGRLSNGAAVLGNLLSIKPILYFNDEGVIEVFEKIRTEKKAYKRLADVVAEHVATGNYTVRVLEANAMDKAEVFRTLLEEKGIDSPIEIVPLGSVVGTHLGEGAIACCYTPNV